MTARVDFHAASGSLADVGCDLLDDAGDSASLCCGAAAVGAVGPAELSLTWTDTCSEVKSRVSAVVEPADGPCVLRAPSDPISDDNASSLLSSRASSARWAAC